MVARYRHAQLSAIRLAGDINARVTDNASLDELLVKIKDELTKLAPLIDLEVIREPQGSKSRAARPNPRYPPAAQGLEPGRLSLAARIGTVAQSFESGPGPSGALGRCIREQGLRRRLRVKVPPAASEASCPQLPLGNS